jgi:hypothetical protein
MLYTQRLTGRREVRTMIERRENAAIPISSFSCPIMGVKVSRWFLIQRDPWIRLPRKMPRPHHLCTKLSFS